MGVALNQQKQQRKELQRERSRGRSRAKTWPIFLGTAVTLVTMVVSWFLLLRKSPTVKLQVAWIFAVFVANIFLVVIEHWVARRWLNGTRRDDLEKQTNDCWLPNSGEDMSSETTSTASDEICRASEVKGLLLCAYV